MDAEERYIEALEKLDEARRRAESGNQKNTLNGHKQGRDDMPNKLDEMIVVIDAVGGEHYIIPLRSVRNFIEVPQEDGKTRLLIVVYLDGTTDEILISPGQSLVERIERLTQGI